MTAMLASVNCLQEALLVESLNVDIVDLKQPALGALGALEIASVMEIVNGLQPSTRISATIGDLPMQVEQVLPAAQAMAATGVDYVKIGFFPGGDWSACIDALQTVSQQGHDLVAVLFADTQPDLNVLYRLQAAGFYGVMLDTMNKQAGSLTQLMTIDELQAFVELARRLNLLSGLAGSLRIKDVADLLVLQPDYLGFRGALCDQHCRTATLDAEQITRLRSHWI